METTATHIPNPFRSFLIGGYECCDMVNRHGDRVDLLTATRHIENIARDYDDLARYNIRTVREGIRWSLVETSPGIYDWSWVDRILHTSHAQGIQVVWDLCHFGMPADLTPMHPHFAKSFEALCTAFVQHYRKAVPEGLLIITPINEVSFFSWLGGEVGCTTPYCKNIGWAVKYEYVKAYIRGIRAMREVDDKIVIVSTEPLVDIVSPLEAGLDEKLKALEATRKSIPGYRYVAREDLPGAGRG